MIDSTLNERSNAYCKIKHLIWCRCYFKNPLNPDERLCIYKANFPLSSGPFTWSADKPDLPHNSAMHIRNPTLLEFLEAWAIFDRIRGNSG